MSGRANFDEYYEMLLAKQKKLNEKDKMNILYVALTRAIESMVVIRKEKASIFDALGMRPMVVGELRQAQLPSPELVEGKGSLSITHYGTQDLNKEEDEEEKDYDAILFGTALHYTLEMMSSFSLMGMAEAMAATKNRYGLLLTTQKLEEIKKRVLDLVTNSHFQKLLEGAEVSNEQSLSFEEELKQVDLLLTYENKCVVIDYKSSKKYHLKHVSQVRHYKKAIQSIVGKPTTGVLVYLLEDKTEFVGT
jgi:exodeoxyribonuclease V beta subunit